MLFFDPVKEKKGSGTGIGTLIPICPTWPKNAGHVTALERGHITAECGHGSQRECGHVTAEHGHVTALRMRSRHSASESSTGLRLAIWQHHTLHTHKLAIPPHSHPPTHTSPEKHSDKTMASPGQPAGFVRVEGYLCLVLEGPCRSTRASKDRGAVAVWVAVAADRRVNAR
eukprot:1795165-Rhodomonas_salina.3